MRGDYPRFILEDEQVLACGYAPRVLLPSNNADQRLFLGCKDGSLVVLSKDRFAGRFELSTIGNPSSGAGTRHAVRALCEVGEEWIIVGRGNGQVEAVSWRRAVSGEDQEYKMLLPPSPDKEDAVRHISWLGSEHLLISFRLSRSRIFKKEDILFALQYNRYEGHIVGHPFSLDEDDHSTLRLAVQLGSSSKRWLLATSRGGLWVWEEEDLAGQTPHRAKAIRGIWHPLEIPGFVNDIAVMRKGSGEPAQAILLATEIGVYFIDLSNGVPERAVRLSLPGLGVVGMALTYTQSRKHGFLWAADMQGDSHLFWRELRPGVPEFLPSGIVHAKRQVVLALSWQRKDKSVVFAQVRRNDGIAFSRYVLAKRQEKDLVRQDPGKQAGRRTVGRLRRYRQILSSGTLERVCLELGQADQEESAQFSEWPDYAILADFFELLASNDDGIRALQEFLSNPSAEIAHRILAEISRDGSFAKQVENAIRLWVLTLLGTVNRMHGDKQASYLGIVRWLRGVEHLAVGDCEMSRILSPAVQRGIRFVRKWGLFGEANAQRKYLVGPLEKLRSQLLNGNSLSSEFPYWPDGVEQEPEALDLLTYEALLFHRQFDVLHQDDRGRMRGRTAWDVSIIDAWGRKLVAVSWTWGGVELFELKKGANGSLSFCLIAVIRESPKGPEINHSLIPRSPAEEAVRVTESEDNLGYSRAVILVKLEERYLLLTSPAGGDRSRRLRHVGVNIWEISQGRGSKIQVRKRALDRQSGLLRRGESVYCFLEVEEGRILVGLRGVQGHPCVALLALNLGPRRFSLQIKYLDLHPKPVGTQTNGDSLKGSPSKGASENRVRSLAREVPRMRNKNGPLRGPHRVLVGCEGGEVLHLTIPQCLDINQAARELSYCMVGQMNSPVMALAYVSGYCLDSEEPLVSRIFCGAADGSIVAWQELREGNRVCPRFAPLWATVEQAPITAIHPIAYGPDLSPSESLVIAVVRSGRCIVFDDCLTIEAPDKRKRSPQRPRFPGSRLGRLKFPGTALASKLITELPSFEQEASSEFIWKRETGRYGILLTASEHGRLRLMSLHFPQHMSTRREQYLRVLELWWRIVRRQGGESWDLLRLADATYQAIPLLPLILVQWILDPSWPTGEFPFYPNSGEIPAWQVPRYLRQLLSLRLSWKDFAEKEKGERALKELLRNAWRLEDLDLFQQICEMTLKRANFAIVDQASGADNDRSQSLLHLYLRLFDVIEQAQPLWLGAPEQKEGRSRMAVAKALIDGDTFGQVLYRAAHETEWGGGPFSQILEKRIEGVRQLVFKRDSLVSLETLRALNLSLMRLCRRLVEQSGEREWRPQREFNEKEVFWPVFVPYFEELVYAAARTFSSRLELNDSLAHEYSRTFALVVRACPSAAIRIANRMTETRLISDPNSEQDLSRRVVLQFKVLSDIGLPTPPRAIELFKLASWPSKDLNPVRSFLRDHGFQGGINSADDPVAIEEFGVENAEDLFCLGRLYKVVDWFFDLGRRLSTDAKGIDLTKDRLDKLFRELEDPTQKLEILYTHSVQFWRSAVSSLGRFNLEDVSGETIRPEMVLRSRGLQLWAKGQVGELDRLYRDRGIFQPEYPIFREVLSRLERAAADFPNSAAVQKNIVLAVFGHHLLEDLDEHVFELEELAQNLDPLMVWKFRGQGRTLAPLGEESDGAPGPVAQTFAHYLIRRARQAGSIPKNLRALHGLLDSPRSLEADLHATLQADEALYSIEQLLQSFGEFWAFSGGPSERRINSREFQCLSLALSELEGNFQKHSGLEPVRKDRDKPSVYLGKKNPILLKIKMPFLWDDLNVRRLDELRKRDLQGPYRPQDKRDVPSTGTGFYLANLAASVVNWRLRIIETPHVEKPPRSGVCTLTLHLFDAANG